MQLSRLSSRAIFAAATLAVASPSVLAQTATWNGTVDSNWTTQGNWDTNSVPVSGQTALFNNAGNGNTTISLSGAAQPIGSIFFDAAAAPYVLGNSPAGDVFNFDAAGQLAMNSGVTANEEVGASITNAGAFTVTNSTTNSPTSPILTIGDSASPGTLTLSSAAGQTFTIAGPGRIVFNHAIQDSSGVPTAMAITSTGSVIFNGAITSNGNTTISGAGAKVMYNATATGSGTLSITPASASTVVTINAARGGTGGLDLGGTYTGSLLLNAQSTYSAGTTLNGPAAQVQLLVDSTSVSGNIVSGPLGTGTINFIGSTPSKLVPIGGDRTLANPIFWTNGMFAETNATADPTPRSLTLSGPIFFGTTGRTSTNNIVGASLIFGDPNNPSTMNLGASMTFSTNVANGGQSTIINDVVKNNPAGGTGALAAQNRCVLILNAANLYTGTTTATGTAANGYGTIFVNNTTGSGTGTGAVTIRGVNAGVGLGGTLGGSGTISGTVNVSPTASGQQGGNLSPGSSGVNSPGTLTTGQMTWNPVGRYIFDYNASNNATGGGVNDLVRNTGTGKLVLTTLTTSAKFDLNLNPLPTGSPTGTPATYVIASYAGGVTPPTGFSGTDLTPYFSFSGIYDTSVAPTVTLNGNDIDINFVPVPEPTTLLLASLGAIGLAIRPRRRRFA